jgi:hypothetical protein
MKTSHDIISCSHKKTQEDLAEAKRQRMRDTEKIQVSVVLCLKGTRLSNLDHFNQPGFSELTGGIFQKLLQARGKSFSCWAVSAFRTKSWRLEVQKS